MKIKLTARERLRALFNGTLEDHRAAFLRGDDVSSEVVNADLAMKYSAVNACIRVRAETFASVPIILYRKMKDGREPVTDELIYDVLHNQPNDEMAPFAFRETMMTNFDIGGNTVSQKLLNRSGEVVGLVPLPHQNISIRRDPETKRLVYEYSGGETRVFKRAEVFHVPNLSFDGVVASLPSLTRRQQSSWGCRMNNSASIFTVTRRRRAGFSTLTRIYRTWRTSGSKGTER
jgi:phage portal protein BeeE